jgi:hypothetical protein
MMYYVTLLEFSTPILLQVGIKSGKFGEMEMSGGLEGSQYDDRTDNYSSSGLEHAGLM